MDNVFVVGGGQVYSRPSDMYNPFYEDDEAEEEAEATTALLGSGGGNGKNMMISPVAGEPTSDPINGSTTHHV